MCWLSKQGPNHKFRYTSQWSGGRVGNVFEKQTPPRWRMPAEMLQEFQKLWKNFCTDDLLSANDLFFQFLLLRRLLSLRSSSNFFATLRLFQDGDILMLWRGGESKLFVFFAGVEVVKARGRCVKSEPISCCWGFNRCDFSRRWREKWSVCEAA